MPRALLKRRSGASSLGRTRTQIATRIERVRVAFDASAEQVRLAGPQLPGLEVAPQRWCHPCRLFWRSSIRGGDRVSELQKARRRVKVVRAIRRSTELEGSRSTNATRADQVAYARGTISAAELGDRVRRRYKVK
jgi:hypothetical protein